MDVARSAGVDKALVSRVVNEDPTLMIRPATRERIVTALKELGYRPHSVARSLRTDRAKTVGLFVPDFANPVYAEIISGADAAALALGNVLMIGAEQAGSEDPKAFLTLLDQSRVDGVLLAGGSVSSKQQKLLSEQGVPWLLVNRRSNHADRYLILDDEYASRLAVNHLLDLVSDGTKYAARGRSCSATTETCFGTFTPRRDNSPSTPMAEATLATKIAVISALEFKSIAVASAPPRGE